jgi:dCTP deaminase
MILADHQIRYRLDQWHPPDLPGGFRIGTNALKTVGRELDPEQIQPASVDLRLGDTFLVPKPDSTTHLDLREGVPKDYYQLVKLTGDDDCFVLHPGEFVLGTTQEWVELSADLAAHVDGRSSIGRLGISCHVTAGWVDPGFVGQITLEMCNFGKVAVKLYAGFKVCQLILHQMSSPAEKPYCGRYQNQVGATGSRV